MRTIIKSFTFEGIGLHSGNMSKVIIRPNHNPEIIFRHSGQSYNVRNACVSGGYATRLTWDDGYFVSMTEHLMAAAWCSGISGLEIEVFGNEIPALDGSASPWIDAFKKSGISPLTMQPDCFVLSHNITFEGKNGSFATASPSDDFKLTIHTDYKNSGIGSCSMSLPDANIREWAGLELAPARTFVESVQIDTLRKNGLAQGGSLENAVVFDTDGCVLNPEGLRMKEEPHRHKMLDVIGDLFLLSSNIKASINIHRPGHDVTAGLTRAMAQASQAFHA